MINDNTTAWESFAQATDSVGSPKTYAIQKLTEIARLSKLAELSPADIATALGAGYEDWSANHVYYKVQAISLRIIGPIGTTIVYLMGVGYLVSIIKNATSKAYTWFTSIAGSALAFFSSAESSVLGCLSRLPGLVGMRDSVRDQDAPLTPDALGYVLTSSLPPLFGSIPSAVASSLGVISSAFGSFTAGTPSSTAPTIAAAGSTTTANTVTSATTAATTAITGSNTSLAGDIAAGSTVVSSLIGAGSTLFAGSNNTDATTVASDAGNSASDLSASLDSANSVTLDSLNAGLSDGSTSVSDLADPSANGYTLMDNSMAGRAVSHLIKVLGAPLATQVVHNIVRIARSRKGDYAALRRNNSSQW